MEQWYFDPDQFITYNHEHILNIMCFLHWLVESCTLILYFRDCILVVFADKYMHLSTHGQEQTNGFHLFTTARLRFCYNAI